MKVEADKGTLIIMMVMICYNWITNSISFNHNHLKNQRSFSSLCTFVPSCLSGSKIKT
jgi:hypothetical protein